MYIIVWCDRNGSDPVAENLTYLEALRRAAVARIYIQKYGYKNVTLKILKVPLRGQDRRFVQDQIRDAMVKRNFDLADRWLKQLRMYDEYQED